jgi:hypothetical protein
VEVVGDVLLVKTQPLSYAPPWVQERHVVVTRDHNQVSGKRAHKIASFLKLGWAGVLREIAGDRNHVWSQCAYDLRQFRR